MKIRNLLLIVVLLLVAMCTSAFVPAQVAEPPAPVDWSALFSLALQAVLVAVLPLVASWIRQFLKAKTEEAMKVAESYYPDLLSSLREAVNIAVQAAEQSGLSNKIADKKVYARDIVQKWLRARGVSLDLALIDAAIEAQVLINDYPHKSKPTEDGSGAAESKQR